MLCGAIFQENGEIYVGYQIFDEVRSFQDIYEEQKNHQNLPVSNLNSFGPQKSFEVKNYKNIECFFKN